VCNVTVTVSNNGPGDEVSVVVEDDGPGFPAELLLGPVEGFKTTKRGGTGLGLYTCERLLWSGGGRLKRANTERGGARVEVTLCPPRVA
jgi:C4-dicarboxylate-specific signal transduction histidine kinase